MKSRRVVLALVATGTLLAPAAWPRAARTAAARQPATQAASVSNLDAVINALTFRNIGPFRTAAWVTSIAVPESPVHDHLYTMYAATRSGGLWKTTNAGTTWTPISDTVG